MTLPMKYIIATHTTEPPIYHSDTYSFGSRRAAIV